MTYTGNVGRAVQNQISQAIQLIEEEGWQLDRVSAYTVDKDAERALIDPPRVFCKMPQALPPCSRIAIRASFVSIMPLRTATM